MPLRDVGCVQRGFPVQKRAEGRENANSDERRCGEQGSREARESAFVRWEPEVIQEQRGRPPATIH